MHTLTHTHTTHTCKNTHTYRLWWAGSMRGTALVQAALPCRAFGCLVQMLLLPLEVGPLREEGALGAGGRSGCDPG